MADTVSNKDSIAEIGAARQSGGAAEVRDFDRQDIRLAVVMNGGVSLAIWMSGVTLEVHHLVLSGRGQERAWPVYDDVLDLLRADVRVDVIAGTSAGGINGIFLALAQARDRDLHLMLELWRDHAGLEALLRDPLQRNPPSLLKGDDYFLPQIRAALADVLGPKGALEQPSGPAAANGQTPIELIITGTLWDGRSSFFTDDMGARITEIDYDATFRFTNDSTAASNGSATRAGNLAADAVLGELAAAGRCTSSFPAAFEPHWVKVQPADGAGEGKWDSGAGVADFAESQYLIDGGVLLNKPIRPALEAIYRQTADLQVRRILAYVAPGAAKPSASPSSPRPGSNSSAQGASASGQVPAAEEVLLGVLTRLRSTDSVSRELTEIGDQNAAARARRRERASLAAAMTTLALPLSKAAWQGYLETRAGSAALVIGRLLAVGQAGSTGRWSETELIAVLQHTDMPFVPHGTLDSAVSRKDTDWDWGQTTVQRLGDMAVDVLKRAMWLAGMDTAARKDIGTCREALGTTLSQIQAERGSLNAYWLATPQGSGEYGIRSPMPPRRGSDTAAANTAELVRWLTTVLTCWDDVPSPGARKAMLYRQALALADHLRAAAGAIGDVVQASGNNPQQMALDPDGRQRDQLRSLHHYLLLPREGGSEPTAEDVLQRMLRLDVVQLGFSGAMANVEQEVELVRMSSDNDRLTGMQLHHFGAFYRPSWRVNDWLQGRMDGATQIIRMLLAPERLRQVGYVAADRSPASITSVSSKLIGKIRDIAGVAEADATAPEEGASPGGNGDDAWLQRQWRAQEAACQAEADRVVTLPRPGNATGQASSPGASAGNLGDAGPPAAGQAMEACARAIARRIQLGILREDLPTLAEAVRTEEDLPEPSRMWLTEYDAARQQLRLDGAQLPAGVLWDLWEKAGQIGQEKIADDARTGSSTFARTATHAAAVAASALGSPSSVGGIRQLKGTRAVASVLAAFRGYTLMVWAMVGFLTRGSGFSTRIVELALAVGGVLVAVTILIPGMPLALILSGVTILLAGITAAALLDKDTPVPGGSTRPRHPARGVGWRVAGAVLLLCLALGGYLWREWSLHGPSALWNPLIKIGVTLLVVLLGWWVARVRPTRR